MELFFIPWLSSTNRPLLRSLLAQLWFYPMGSKIAYSISLFVSAMDKKIIVIVQCSIMMICFPDNLSCQGIVIHCKSIFVFVFSRSGLVLRRLNFAALLWLRHVWKYASDTSKIDVAKLIERYISLPISTVNRQKLSLDADRGFFWSISYIKCCLHWLFNR